MPNIIDITNQRFGRLVALQPVEKRRRCWFWKCLCDCGAHACVRGNYLRSGHTQSCGCLWFKPVAHGNARRGAQTAEHFSWAAMIQRCTNPKHTYFKNYGGRGIKVCERWRSFENFLTDMGSRPDGCTIDRVNNDGDYEPSNCKWATRAAQAANRRPRRRS